MRRRGLNPLMGRSAARASVLQGHIAIAKEQGHCPSQGSQMPASGAEPVGRPGHAGAGHGPGWPVTGEGDLAAVVSGIRVSLFILSDGLGAVRRRPWTPHIESHHKKQKDGRGRRCLASRHSVQATFA